MDSNLLRQMQEMQRRADELQKGLAAMEVEGVAGGGLVRAVVNGLGELKKLSIDPSILKPDEHGIVEDLVVAACADGKVKLEARRMQDSQFVQDLLKSFSAGLPDSD
ncbi:MAG TPA: YbaB/EbfC family nucleoid-associated protein [Micropepsaceae bacterium]|nr:YbaB/EbfC family nucleoid-associated protein [Micropepsaceae bacterium]